MELPKAFENAMKSLLGEEYEEFLKSYEVPARRGLRRNPLKCSEEQLLQSLPFSLEPTPFSPLSFILKAARKKWGIFQPITLGCFIFRNLPLVPR